MYRLNELANLASRYLDTAKGDLPVKSVVFVGEAPDSRLPPGMWGTYNEHIKFRIASISFENRTNRKDSNRLKTNVDFVALWKDGVPEIFTMIALDSLLKVNPTIDNGN